MILIQSEGRIPITYPGMKLRRLESNKRAQVSKTCYGTNTVLRNAFSVYHTESVGLAGLEPPAGLSPGPLVGPSRFRPDPKVNMGFAAHNRGARVAETIPILSTTQSCEAARILRSYPLATTHRIGLLCCFLPVRALGASLASTPYSASSERGATPNTCYSSTLRLQSSSVLSKAVT